MYENKAAVSGFIVRSLAAHIIFPQLCVALFPVFSGTGRQKKSGVLQHLESKIVNTQLRLD